MSIQQEELQRALDTIGSAGSSFFSTFLLSLNEYLGDDIDICFRVYNPKLAKVEDTTGITNKTVVVLWGDERSVHFPKQFHTAAKNIIKYHLPPAWMNKGFIPVTDALFAAPTDEQLINIQPCSKRPNSVFYSGNLNYRRIDLYRGLSGSSFGYPFRLSACYPVNGSQPLLHKIEASVLLKIITRVSTKMDFSYLFPNSYVRFTDGFGKGLSKSEYVERLLSSKISICPPGFATNETIRLMESCLCGTAIICGHLPELPMYEGHPFVEIKDWRRIKWVVDELLNDQDRLDEIGYACKEWYDKHFSPVAQARRVAMSILAQKVL